MVQGRFAITLSYLGTNYHGWQIQPNAITVQEILGKKVSSLQRSETEIVGCGRTDAGVHARNYVAHLDLDIPDQTIEMFQHKLNRMLPKDIVVHKILPVKESFHARFDATSRLYRYYLSFEKDPFNLKTKYIFVQSHQCDWERVQAAGKLLTKYSDFAPFCKAHSDVKNFKCQLTKSNWKVGGKEAVFTIRSNRFLRGMVRLIVGMCLDVGLGKLDLTQVEQSLIEQQPLSKSWSVPAEGLFLEEILYPD